MTSTTDPPRSAADQPSRPTDAAPPNHRTWSGKWGVWGLLIALALGFAAVSSLVFTTPLTRNDLGLLGGLRVTSDEATVVYAGDRRIGEGTVDVSWNELLGAAGRPPLAIPVGAEFLDGELPELLGDGTAEIVWSKTGGDGGVSRQPGCQLRFSPSPAAPQRRPFRSRVSDRLRIQHDRRAMASAAAANSHAQVRRGRQVLLSSSQLRGWW